MRIIYSEKRNELRIADESIFRKNRFRNIVILKCTNEATYFCRAGYLSDSDWIVVGNL